MILTKDVFTNSAKTEFLVEEMVSTLKRLDHKLKIVYQLKQLPILAEDWEKLTSPEYNWIWKHDSSVKSDVYIAVETTDKFNYIPVYLVTQEIYNHVIQFRNLRNIFADE